MNPRLKTSKKWTAFPTEYLKQIEEVFEQGFKEQLKNSKLVVEGRIYPGEILLRVGVRENKSIRQANFEVSMDLDLKKKNTVERLHDCIDGAASMMQEYFDSIGKEDEEPLDFPLVWQEYDFNNQKLYFQYSGTNTDLEAEANALLGETAEEALVREEAEDALDELDEEDESGKKPTRH
jgi:hypothetical protein